MFYYTTLWNIFNKHIIYRLLFCDLNPTGYKISKTRSAKIIKCYVHNKWIYLFHKYFYKLTTYLITIFHNERLINYINIVYIYKYVYILFVVLIIFHVIQHLFMWFLSCFNMRPLQYLLPPLGGSRAPSRFTGSVSSSLTTWFTETQQTRWRRPTERETTSRANWSCIL